jgi:hypothetical protein
VPILWSDRNGSKKGFDRRWSETRQRSTGEDVVQRMGPGRDAEAPARYNPLSSRPAIILNVNDLSSSIP